MTGVGFVGAGRIGAPMIARLVEAGHHVRAVGRSPEKRDAVEKLGATGVQDVEDAAHDADIVIICVFTDEQVQRVCLESELIPSMKPGSVIVVHTTGSPQTTKAVAAKADRRFIDVVDAPVSGAPHDVEAGRITLFVGGDRAAVEQVIPVLSSYGDPVLHVGPLGAGQAVKLLNNLLFAANIGLVSEAVKLGGRLGIVEPTLLSALTNGSGTSNALRLIAAAGSTAQFITTVREFIGKDVAVVREALAELEIDIGRLDDVVNSGLPTLSPRA
jgi:3-hydroxyisobutyrate dehydrogenase-like beta-hydroxyacid dehydrogenase